MFDRPKYLDKRLPVNRAGSQVVVRVIAVLVLFSPLFCRAEYIKAVNYFGRSWPITFWNSDLSHISADFEDIRRDGFNSIILIVPWGEFQPGVNPIRFNEDAYRRLGFVCSAAHAVGLKVFMRVSYTWDYYPGVQQPTSDRSNALISSTSLIPAWDQYLAKINTATQGCSEAAFISWEDFWTLIQTVEALKSAEQRAAYSKQIGYSEWIDRHADDDYKSRHAAEIHRWGVYPVPKRDSSDFEMVFQYFDDQLINRLLPVLAKNFTQASLEARIDRDPIYDGEKLVKLYAHPSHYRVKSSDYLMTYWAPAIGAVNNSEKEPANKVLDRFIRLQRNLLTNTSNKIFIDQWLFKDSTPGFSRNAQVEPTELSQFIRDFARPLAQFTAGYALWSWRDFQGSILFNGFFSLGIRGWDFSPGAGIQRLADGIYARISEGQFISQKVPLLHDHFRRFFDKYELRFTARGTGRVRIQIGSATQEAEIQAIKSAVVLTLEFPMGKDMDPDVRITALSGAISISGLYLWNFEQISNVRSSDNTPYNHYDDIVALNRALDDPNVLVSSVSASDDSINYLIGAEGPEFDGTRKFAWVGPDAKVRLHATAPTIWIRGHIDVAMFRKAKLFPAGCTLAAWINGKMTVQTLFTASQEFVLKVTVPPESRGDITLQLKNNCSLNLKELGLGSDSRTLSYGISDIRAESNGEGESNAREHWESFLANRAFSWWDLVPVLLLGIYALWRAVSAKRPSALRGNNAPKQ